MNLKINKGTVIVNGKKYVGSNVVIDRDRLFIDGTEHSIPSDIRTVNVTVDGDCEYVENESGSVTVSGFVHGNVQTGSGDIKCGGVGGNVQTGSGDVDCENVAGSVRTGSGDITHK